MFKKILASLLILATLAFFVPTTLAITPPVTKMVAGNLKVASDWNMEASGTTAFESYNATLAKMPGSAVEGKQFLRMTNTNGSTAYIYVAVLGSSSVTVTAKLRGDGTTTYPRLLSAPGVTCWQGTISTDWQTGSCTFTPVDGLRIVSAINTIGTWIDIDDIIIRPNTVTKIITEYAETKINNVSRSGNFDGATSYVSIPNSSAFQPGTGDFSVSFWTFRTGTSTGDYPQIIGSRAWVTSIDWGWSICYRKDSDEKLTTHYDGIGTGWDVTGGSVDSSSPVALNTWQHWTVVFDKTNGKLKYYLNGVVDNIETPPFPTSIEQTDIIYIGNTVVGTPARGYSGIIDDIKIWKKALSDDEVSAVYQNIPVKSGLQAEYKFNEGEGTDVRDSSGNGYHATSTALTYSTSTPSIYK